MMKLEHSLAPYSKICCSVTQLCLILCESMDWSMPGFPVPQHLLELAQTHVHWVDDAIQPSHPLLSPSLASVFPSIRVFSNELSLCIRPKYWSFSFSISPFNEYSGLISFSIDWLDLLTVQGTLKSLLQHHSSKASIPTRMATSKVGWNFVSYPPCLAHCLVHSQCTIHTYWVTQWNELVNQSLRHQGVIFEVWRKKIQEIRLMTIN